MTRQPLPHLPISELLKIFVWNTCYLDQIFNEIEIFFCKSASIKPKKGCDNNEISSTSMTRQPLPASPSASC